MPTNSSVTPSHVPSSIKADLRSGDPKQVEDGKARLARLIRKKSGESMEKAKKEAARIARHYTASAVDTSGQMLSEWFGAVADEIRRE